MKHNNWWADMSSVFNMMDCNEKEVLVSASVFHGRIPRAAFADIFTDTQRESLKEDAENLCRCVIINCNSLIFL